MPLRFDSAHVETGEAFITHSPTPASATFHVLTANEGGRCVVCRQEQHGICWGGDAWVMCAACATDQYGAPDLRLGIPVTAGEDEESTDEPAMLTTKRDKAFDPSYYVPYTHGSDLKGRNGCSGYKCETTAAPYRTLVKGVTFYMGRDDRGYLCIACFGKMKAKWDENPRSRCNHCEYSRITSSLVQTMYDGMVCTSCIRDSFMATPHTDGGWIQRGSSMPWCNTVAHGRVYASYQWASTHWFRAGEHWMETQEEADAINYSADTIYRDHRVATTTASTVFPYGTNIIKMLGFPSVTAKDALCFGVELEMVPNVSHVHEAVIDTLGGKWVPDRPYILCRDGSLGEAGVEMITLPFTLDAHKSDKYVPWKKTLAALRHVAMSGKNTRVCGMHVHINRRALSQLQMGKMLVVINAPEMQELVCCIAQRSDGGYAHRKFAKVSDGKFIEGTHFDALNVATSKGTCELRIFRGNLRYERVMKNLEFTEALCMYAAQQSMQLLTDPALLVAWIHANAVYYPYLSKFLKETYKPSKDYEKRAKAMSTIKSHEMWRRAGTGITVAETEGDI